MSKSAILNSDEDLEFLQSLKNDFYVETKDSVERAESLLLNFESSKDELSLLDYKRLLHSVKGSAKAVEEAEYAMIVHKVEDSIAGDKGEAFFELNFKFLDISKNYLEMARSGDFDSAQAVLDEFKSLLK